MEGLFFLIILGLVLWYEIFIFKSYKKFILKNGEKVKHKLIFLFLIFLPFYDVIIGYSKIGLDIIQEPTIQITDAGKKFKQDYLFFDRFLRQDDFTIEEVKLEEFIYKVIKIDDKYYGLFALDTLNKNIKDNQIIDNKDLLENIKKDLLIKYKSIEFVYLYYTRFHNKYYNYFTHEELLISNFNFNIINKDMIDLKYYPEYNKYSASYNNFVYPIHLSGIGGGLYYEFNTRIYTMYDYLIDSEYFNVKYFFITYFLVSLLIFVYLLFRIKVLYLLFYLGSLFIIPNLFSYVFIYKDSNFTKNDLTLKDLNINPEKIRRHECYKISFDNFINKKEFNKNFYKFYLYNNYKFETLNYYNKDGTLKKETCIFLYEKIYTKDSLFGYYNLYNLK